MLAGRPQRPSVIADVHTPMEALLWQLAFNGTGARKSE